MRHFALENLTPEELATARMIREILSPWPSEDTPLGRALSSGALSSGALSGDGGVSAGAALAGGICQYIAGEELGDEFKCGAPVIPGKPYCAKHYALCMTTKPFNQKGLEKAIAAVEGGVSERNLKGRGTAARAGEPHFSEMDLPKTHLTDKTQEDILDLINHSNILEMPLEEAVMGLSAQDLALLEATYLQLEGSEQSHSTSMKTDAEADDITVKGDDCG